VLDKSALYAVRKSFGLVVGFAAGGGKAHNQPMNGRTVAVGEKA